MIRVMRTEEDSASKVDRASRTSGEYIFVWWPSVVYPWRNRSKVWVVRGLTPCTLFGETPVGYKRVCPYVLKRIGVIHSDRKKMWDIGR